MRIISGDMKGRRLASVRGEVRPTSDKLRESLFNVVGDRVRGSVWVDLFAGTGAIGIEALSRGAAFVLFNDRSHSSLKLIEKNLRLCDVLGGFRVVSTDAFKLLAAGTLERPADFIFADPPYAFRRYERLTAKVLESPLLTAGGTLVLEVFKKTSFDPAQTGAEVERTLQVGDSLMHFLKTSR